MVALDKLSTTASIRGGDEFDAQGPLTPVVPGLGVQSEYGFTVAPYFANSGLFDPAGVGSPDEAPDPRRELATGYDGWTAAGVDSMVIVPRASTHLEYTDIAYVLPASRYGQAVASHYTQAWLGKYLQHDPAADDALLGDVVRLPRAGLDRHLAAGRPGPRRAPVVLLLLRLRHRRPRPGGRSTTTSPASAADVGQASGTQIASGSSAQAAPTVQGADPEAALLAGSAKTRRCEMRSCRVGKTAPRPSGWPG